MTPLIAEMVNYFKDISAEKYVWFDISEQWAVADETIDYDRAVLALQNPLPFDKCILVGREKDGSAFIVVIGNTVLRSTGEKGLVIHSQVLHKEGIGVCPVFFVSPEQTVRENSNEGMAIYFLKKEEADIEAANDTLVCISFWLEKLNETTMLTYHAVASSRNPKRIRQGKKPMFDWHTVVLEPRSVKSEYLGGTHSSPRLHDVRGHWVMRGNKKFWRKPHKRGDASKGVIFHDYKLKGEKSESISNT